MTMPKTLALSLFAGLALISLSACDRVEQAATEAIDQAKQSAIQAIDEARETGSIEQLQQSANEAVDQARQKAAGLLGEASELLGQDLAPETAAPGEQPTTTEL